MLERKTRNDVLILWMIFVLAVKGLYVAFLLSCFIPSWNVMAGDGINYLQMKGTTMYF